MSSESASYYVVDINAQLEEAARQAALTAADQCARDFEQLRTALQQVCHEFRDVGVTATPVATPEAAHFDLQTRPGADAYLAQWRAARAEVDLALRRARGLGPSRRFLRSLAPSSTSRTAQDILADQVRVDANPALTALPQQLQDILAEVVGDPHEVDALRADARRLLEAAAEASEIAAALVGFRERAKQMTDATHRRIRDVDEATALLVQLAGLTGPRVEAVVEQLRRVTSGEEIMTTGLRERVTLSIEEARAAADAAWVAVLVRGKLTDLGYEVTSDFETATPRGGALSASKREWCDGDGTPLHEVQIDFDPSSDNLLKFEVLHETQEGLAEQRRNTAVESEWCQDHLRLLRHLRDRAVQVEVDRSSLVGPGQRDPARITAPSKKRRRHRVPRRSRQLDH